jgi:hypothetical protein
MNLRRHLAPAIAAILLTPIAAAQDADPMCGALDRILSSAQNEIPFISLVPATQSLGSLPRLQKKPLGMEEFRSCDLYRAGNAKQGTVGGGPHNYLRCSAFWKMTEPTDTATRDAATEIWNKLSARAKACLEPAGWTASGGERTRKYEDYITELAFAKPDTSDTVVVTLEEDSPSPGSRSRSVTWSVDIAVRNPNPNHPKPS